MYELEQNEDGAMVRAGRLIDSAESTPNEYSFAESAGYAVGSAVVSAGVQLYDIPTSVGNLFREDDVELTDIEGVVYNSLGAEASSYYSKNKAGVDVAGFVISSLVPGLGAAKALTASQKAVQLAAKGKDMHPMLKNVTKLVAPNVDSYLSSVKVSSAIDQTASKLRGENLKALIAGGAQNTMEAAAFEIGVAVAMGEGEVLGDMTTKELLTNMLVGTAFGAGIGTAFSAVQVARANKLGLSDNAELWNKYSLQKQWSDSAPASVVAGASIMELRKANTELSVESIMQDVSKSNLAGEAKVVTALTSNLQKLRTGYENSAREALMEITGGDRVISEHMLTKWKTASDDIVAKDIFGLSQLVPAGKATTVESAIKKDKRAFPTEQSTDSYKVTYFDVVAGQELVGKPKYISLQDTGSKLTISGDTVVAGKEKYKVNTDLNLDPPKTYLMSARESEARAFWASEQKNTVFTKASSISADDFASLDTIVGRLISGKLTPDEFKNGALTVRQTDEFGAKTTVVYKLANDFEDLAKAHFNRKLAAAADIYNNRKSKAIPGHSIDERATLLKRITGIDFDTMPSAGNNATWNPNTKRINVTPDALATRSIRANVQTLLHEYGHHRDLATQPTRITASGYMQSTSSLSSPEALKEAIALSKKARPDNWKTAAEFEAKAKKGIQLTEKEIKHIEYMNSPWELLADARAMIALMPEKQLKNYSNLVNEFGPGMYRATDELQRIYGYNIEAPIPMEAIARSLNVSMDSLLGSVDITADSATMFSNMLFRENRLAGLPYAKAASSSFDVPFFHKATYDSSIIKVGANEVRGAAKLMANAKLFAEASEIVADSVLGHSVADVLPKVGGDIQKAFQTTLDNFGTGGGFVTASNRDYGNAGSFTKWIGNITIKASQDSDRAIADSFASTVHILTSKPKVAMAYGILDNQLRRLPHTYVLGEDGTTMVVKELEEYNLRIANGADPTRLEKPNIPEAEQVVDLTKLATDSDLDDLLSVIKSHIQQNDITLGNLIKLDNINGGNKGNLANKIGGYYPLPPDTRNKPFVAYVFDQNIKNGEEHSTMIYAASEAELNLYKANIESHADFGGTVKVRLQSEVSDYYKSVGEFDAAKEFDSVRLRSELTRKGLDAPFEATTNGKVIAENLINFHASAARANIKYAVRTKYSGIFNMLDKGISTHQVKPLTGSKLEKELHPYETYAREMLGVSTVDQFVPWQKLNSAVENVFTTLHDRVYRGFKQGTEVTEDMLLTANKMLAESGFKGAFVTPMTMELANRQVSSHIASKFVSAINGITSFFVLRTDVLHGVNNIIGHNIMYQAETLDVIKRIGAKDPNSSVFKSLNLALPGNGTRTNISHGKLVADATADFWRRPDLREAYTNLGFNLDISKQVQGLIGAGAIDIGKETTESITAKHSAFMEKVKSMPGLLEKATGNKFSEEFTNFVTARTMHIIAEEAARLGVISPDSIWTYVNTFTNRVRGTYNAAQRPALFQGPIGMSMTLFQTYQLNLMQQLFRYGVDGRMKTATAMMGMQASIYGAQGLPGYAAVNSYVANAEGNIDKSDITGQVYQMFNTKGADWLMYGLASNFTSIMGGDGINLYSRGDLNPREMTIIPINPLDAPWFAGWTKFIGNVFESGAKLANGTDAYTAIANGLEHNGLSRPLSGLGKLLQGMAHPDNLGYSTTKEGKLVATFDMGIMNSMIHLAGGKRLDEAKALDALYRQKAYNADAKDAMASLKELIRINAAGGTSLDPDLYKDVMHKFAANGGDMTRWRQFYMSAISEANESTLSVMNQVNGSMYGRDFQAIIGGDLKELYTEQ